MNNNSPNPWSDISKSDNVGSLNTRRERPDSPHNFFWTVNHLGQNGFRFSTSSSVPSPGKLPDLSEIGVFFNEFPSGICVLDFVLTDPSMRDIFLSMSLDLMDSTNGIDTGDDNRVMKALIARITKWQRLLKRPRNDLLSAELQMGLWGEILVLREMFMPNVENVIATEAWSGPLGGEQDFSLAGVTLVEVKTQNAASDRKVKINSVDQLDSRSGVLFLVHQRLAPKSEGMTLQGLVNAVRSDLSDDVAAFGRFERNLFEYGFVNNDAYDNVAYDLSGRTVYRVDDSFPRIRREQVPDGISDLGYRIEIAACDDFVVEEKILINRIAGNADKS